MRNNERGVKRRSQIRQAYWDWMVDLIQGEYFETASRHCLLSLLHETEFTYTMDMDENRAIDGRNLRYRFAYENGYSMNDVKNPLDDRPCSVFEMMVALAIRCEEHIMIDLDRGNRTGFWFADMLKSLGLADMTDERFDYIQAKANIDRFLNREYEADGCGGLFVIQRPRRDLRQVELWYQAMWHLSEILDQERM